MAGTLGSENGMYKGLEASIWPPLVGCLLCLQRDMSKMQPLASLEELPVWKGREMMGTAHYYQEWKGWWDRGTGRGVRWAEGRARFDQEYPEGVAQEN